MRIRAITSPPFSVVCTLPNGPVAQARIGEAVHFRNAGRGIGTPDDHRIDDEFDDVKHPCRHARPVDAQAEAGKRERGTG